MPLISIIDEDAITHVLGNCARPIAFFIIGEVMSCHSKDFRRVDSINCRMTKDRGGIGITVCLVASMRTMRRVLVVQIVEVLGEEVKALEIWKQWRIWDACRVSFFFL